MIEIRTPPGETVDYTHTLEILCPHLLAAGCQVILDPRQFEVLKAYLAHIDQLGDVGFQLENCFDARDFPTSAGYGVSWKNEGELWQDDFIDTLMEDLVQNIGFDAGSIFRPGYVIPLEEIDARIEAIKERVTERSRQRALDSIKSSDEDVSDLKRDWILMARRHGKTAEWIAGQVNLPLETVLSVLSPRRRLP